MTEAEKFLNGKKAFDNSCKLSRRVDDCTIGFVIGIFLGHNFTSVDGFYDQNFNKNKSTLQEALHFIAFSYRTIKKSKTVLPIVPVEPMFDDDPSRFLSYHCLLYPSVSWCKKSTSSTGYPHLLTSNVTVQQ
ncbi:beta-1,3-N-acetylglucosaminyltransferase lunatic fringe-like [Dysidea avara]|uniref:beta-1,3-N-acetylglucosaminyltransferase lunatic fringe-like n=1 Tax=Dysidea avara TaxID=196820 RepID=UPI00332901BA